MEGVDEIGLMASCHQRQILSFWINREMAEIGYNCGGKRFADVEKSSQILAYPFALDNMESGYERVYSYW